MTPPLGVVLVHGAWHNSSCWEPVRAELDRRRIPSVAVQLPMTTLDQDAAVVRAAVDASDHDVIVVGHSWGGSPVTLGAAGSAKVKHLIYLAAFMIDIGQPVTSFDTPASAESTTATVERDGSLLLDPEEAIALLYHDVDPDLAARTIAGLRPMRLSSFAPVETALVAAWKTVPSTYVLTLDDRSIPSEHQRVMARNAGEVVEIDTGHSPFLSRPDLVAGIIAGRCRRVRESRS
ncbi:alpha/beta hydrolase [Actinomadura madurae]|uniref:alpha/beta hydrolase n=1 Tax=Actinomadura madurae TaxID=1993 RepID=UPI00399974DF